MTDAFAEPLSRDRTLYAAACVGVCMCCALLFSPAYAEDAATSPEYGKCLDKSSGVTADMLNCGADEIDRKDKKLNKIYQALMKKSDDKQQTALRESQRSWLSYRKNACDLIYTFGSGGTVDSVVANSCEVDTLASRVKFLESLATE